MSEDDLKFFVSELKSADLRARVFSISKLDVIADRIGKEKARDVLIPLLTDYANNRLGFEDDEGLLAIAKKISCLQASVGAKPLLPILESLACQDETVIREAAVASIIAMTVKEHDKQPDQSAKNKKNQIDFANKEIYPILLRLFADSWFSARVSACSLLPGVYPFISVDSARNELRKQYFLLFDEELPMTRRGAGLKLSEVIKILEPAVAVQECVAPLKKMVSDETQEMLRLAAVQCCVQFSNLQSMKSEVSTIIKPIVLTLSKDKSWRVQMMVARHLAIFCEFFGTETTRNDLLPVLVSALKHPESDVRQASVSVLPQILPYLTQQQICSSILPEIIFLCSDSVVQVRCEVAQILPVILSEVGDDDEELDGIPGERNPRSAVLSLVGETFKDESYHVRVCALSGIPKLSKTLGSAHSKKHILPLAIVASTDTLWRVRFAFVEQIPSLVVSFGKDFFSEISANPDSAPALKLGQSTCLHDCFIKSLGDSVFAVREEAIKKIPAVVSELGVSWLVDKLWPKLNEQFSSTVTYLNRMTVLHSIKVCAKFFSHAQVESKVTPLLIQGLTDSVPNVQICACHAIDEALPFLTSKCVVQLKEPLNKVAEHKDKDISSSATFTLNQLAKTKQ